MAIAAASCINYSSTGAAIARQGRQSYDSATRWNDADRFIGSALDSITSDSQTTCDEKSIARMGYSMGNIAGMQYENSAKARYAAAGAIASAVAGSLGAVMGQVIVEAFNSANRWDDADRIASAGLTEVASNPNTTSLDKDLANLGLAMGNHKMQWENSAKARKEVAKALENTPNGNVGSILADVGHKAVAVSNRWDDADHMAGDALQAVISNPNSSQTQKSLARTALQQTSGGGITWENSAKTRDNALRNIASQT